MPAVVAQLRSDLVIAHATETVYGFATALSALGINRMAALKDREAKPFLLLVAAMETLEELGLHPSPHARALAERWWPGPLTIVCDAADSPVRHPSVRHDAGIAVRWTPHAPSQAIIRTLGAPLVSTSANRSGLPPARSAEEIVREWQPEVSRGDLLVLDGKTAPNAVPSTVVDCRGGVPRVIRAGAVGIDALRAVVSSIEGA